MIRGERTLLTVIGFAGLTSFIFSLCFSAWFRDNVFIAVAGGVFLFIFALFFCMYIATKMGH